MLRGAHAGRYPWLLALCLAAGAAWAQPMPRLAASSPAPAPQPPGKPKVVVLVVPLDTAARTSAGRLDSLAYEAVARSGRFEPMRLTDALDPASAASREAQHQLADAAMKSGLKAYNDLDTQEAYQFFERAMQGYERGDITLHFKDYVKAWTMKLASQIANGETKPALKEMEQVLALDPKAEFPSAYFPPDAIAQSEKLRKKLNNSPATTLEIRSVPVPAEIYLDGTYQGISPVSASGLKGGAEHFITAIAPGYALVQIRAREGVVALTLRQAEGYPRYTAAVRRVIADPKGRDRDAAASELGKSVGAAQVVLVIAQKSAAGQKLDVTVARVAVLDGSHLGAATGTVALDEPVPPQWEALVDPVLAKDTPRVNGGPAAHVEPFRWNERYTGYALLGAGAALLGGSLFCGIQAVDANRQFRETTQLDTTSLGELRTRGRTFGVVADILLLGGLASSAPGGYLAFFGGRPKPASTSGSTGAARVEEPTPAAAKPAPPPSSSSAGSLGGPSSGGARTTPTPPATSTPPAPTTAKPAAPPAKPAPAEHPQAKEEERKPHEEEKKKSEEDDLRNF